MILTFTFVMIFTITIMIRDNPGDLVVRCGEWDTQTEGEPLDHQVFLIKMMMMALEKQMELMLIIIIVS